MDIKAKTLGELIRSLEFISEEYGEDTPLKGAARLKTEATDEEGGGESILELYSSIPNTNIEVVETKETEIAEAQDGTEKVAEREEKEDIIEQEEEELQVEPSGD